jgi:hypothetical protein
MRFTKINSWAILFFMIAMATAASAKEKSRAVHVAQLSSIASYARGAAALEARLTPYFQHKLNRSTVPAKSENRLGETDLFLLVKVWNNLSPEFKKLYTEATAIPSGDVYYVSPGGHFEVYYTTKKNVGGSIDPIDNYGFGAQGDWRVRDSLPNGVPDYVDEVAYALDSAWSMEVDGFQYIPPIPYTDATHPSNRFKVVINSQDPGIYGETFPGKPVGSRGFSSHIEIRNEWSDQDWAGTGYDTIPYNGARVTCAHEFFHTIQYAMAWNDANGVPDSFPLSWIEGTAVMMEGLAFRSVFDYIQYTTDYFDDPTTTVLPASDTASTIYTNSLIAKFLHEVYSPDPYNDFIRRVFFADYKAPIDFYRELRFESDSVKKNWVDILNDYHTQSYFTGNRAVSGVFLQDASLLPQWSFGLDAVPTSGKISKQVNPYALRVFALKPAAVQSDTIGVVFQGDKSTYAYPIWSASCILERLNGTDSIVHFSFANAALASLQISSWHSLKDAMIIVTNGDIAAVHNASITVVSALVASQIDTSENVTIYPNPVHARPGSSVKISGSTITELWVYDAGGKVISHAKSGAKASPASLVQSASGFNWLLANAAGKSVLPGMYYVYLTYKNVLTQAVMKKKQKVLVIP